MLYANGQLIGGNTKERMITLAEYNALSETEKMNNTTYYITDAVPQGKKIQPVIYSNDEREIGVWTDGKPLYQKTVTATISGGGRLQWIDTGVDSNDTIVYSEGFIELSTNGNIITLGSSDPEGQAGLNTFSPDAVTVGKWSCLYRVKQDDTALQAGDLTLTIRYTKASDTAGSGVWTPSGVPAVHYSTDEQVVGTWIDGSTIYEKTFELSYDVSIANDSWTSVTGLSTTNLGMLIDAKCISSAGTLYYLNAYNNNEALNFLACRDGHAVNAKYIIIRYTKSS